MLEEALSDTAEPSAGVGEHSLCTRTLRINAQEYGGISTFPHFATDQQFDAGIIYAVSPSRRQPRNGYDAATGYYRI